MSDRLSNLRHEAESLLDIKLRHAQDPFAHDPHHRIMRFEILCRGDNGDELCVDIGQDGKHLLRSVSTTLGGLNLFYPKQFWDARITVSAAKFLLRDYTAEATSIGTSFKVTPTGGDTAIVTMRRVSHQLKILQGRAIRESFHRSLLYPDLVLKLSEYRDMQLRAPATDERLYEGQIRPCEQLAKHGLVWWQASVSSTRADLPITRGSDSELGELADWSADEDAQDDTITQMLNLADDIVPRMDHIGNVA